AIADAARAAPPPARGRLVRALGRIDGSTEALLAFVDDADDRTRRSAISALGKRGGTGVEAALVARLDGASAAERRAIVDALGKLGSAAVLPRLAELPAGDAELDRIAARARIRVERDVSRGAPSRILGDVAGDGPIPVRALCRRGLERFVEGELGGRAIAPGAVAATLDGPLATMWRARTLLRFGFAVAGDPATALASDAALAIFRRFTDGPIRYRLALGGGPRRAEVMRVAAAVSARRPELVNDPRQSPWEAEVGDGEVLLVPKGLPDPRFDYRRPDVPASS